jgi:hypothetical protein
MGGVKKFHGRGLFFSTVTTRTGSLSGFWCGCLHLLIICPCSDLQDRYELDLQYTVYRCRHGGFRIGADTLLISCMWGGVCPLPCVHGKGSNVQNLRSLSIAISIYSLCTGGVSYALYILRFISKFVPVANPPPFLMGSKSNTLQRQL